MKLCVSSSRCETCPAKGEPARAGSPPGAGRGNKAREAEACERAGHGTAAPKPLVYPDAEGPVFPEGHWIKVRKASSRLNCRLRAP